MILGFITWLWPFIDEAKKKNKACILNCGVWSNTAY